MYWSLYLRPQRSGITPYMFYVPCPPGSFSTAVICKAVPGTLCCRTLYCCCALVGSNKVL